MEFPLSVGFEVNHSKLPILQLVAELSYSNLYKSYRVQAIDPFDFSNNEVLYSYEVKRPRLAFSVGLRLIGKQNKSNQP